MKKLGVVVSVDGNMSTIGMYNLSNDSEYLWKGEILNGVKVGSYITIIQNDIKIIATVSNEKVIDQANSIKSDEFDNRYSPNTINRIVQLSTKGVIKRNSFFITSKYTPMIGNEVIITSKEDLDLIYSVPKSDAYITVGNSLIEDHDIKIPIDPFFASHIGIFGNTGSGKSNTLHKLYYELFNSKYIDGIKEKSKFFIIDFNGEYSSKQKFGIDDNDDTLKRVFNLDTRNDENSEKLPISQNYILDADILSILFDAKPATQVPFLRNAIKLFKQKTSACENMGSFFVGIIKKILTSGNSVNQDALQDWLDIANKYIDYNLLMELNKLTFNSYTGAFFKDGIPQYFNNGAANSIKPELIECYRLNEISQNLNEQYYDLNSINRLKMFLQFQKIFKTSWGQINREFLNPLFSRIDTSLNSLEKVIEIKNNISGSYSVVNVFNLVSTNQETKRVIPMLLSKMFYDQQKYNNRKEVVNSTSHLIIDEAHNILNSNNDLHGDSWEDYRLSTFEEIIKEGRKFGFYLTISSQRPYDISSTIMSQIHNYIIHRLVNDKDLNMLINTMPTLDSSSFKKIPLLGKGEAVITGNSINVPILVKVDRTSDGSRPDSDDIILSKLWSN